MTYSAKLPGLPLFAAPRVPVGARPPGAPQVQRDERRPTRRPPWVSLLARRLAGAYSTPGGRGEEEVRGHERPGGRPHRHVAEEVSNPACRRALGSSTQIKTTGFPISKKMCMPVYFGY